MGESDRPGLRPLVELTRIRVLEFLRQPGALFWVFGFPVVMAVILGLAFRSRPPERIPVAVVAGGTASSGAVAALEADEGLTVWELGPEAASEALRTGKVDLMVTVRPPSSAADGGWVYLYRFDPTRPMSRTARLRVDDALQQAQGRRNPVAVADEEMAEPGARYIDFLIPGLIGLNLMSSSMWGLGFAIVIMRTKRLLKRFAATPMRRSDFLLGLVLSRLVFLAMEVVFLVAIGWLLFGVEVRGSLMALAAVALMGSAGFTGLALLVASRAETVEVASGLMNLAMIPMWLLCGAFFSYERFPEVLHPVVRGLPLTALNDALRAVMNEGASLTSCWPELSVLAVWGVVTFAAALRWFRWQ